MKPFKFLSDGDYDNLIELPESMASWMWDGFAFVDLDSLEYDIIIEYYDGIVDFLNQFPPNSIVLVKSIQGVDTQIEHTYNTEQNGWGFNIQRDTLKITWYKFLGT
jgi:hypothetical protein